MNFAEVGSAFASLNWVNGVLSGIDKLIKHDVYDAAYPLHEVNIFCFLLYCLPWHILVSSFSALTPLFG